jgi:hypothetical protein
MGIDSSTVQFLTLAKAKGVDFSRTLTIGRQSLYGAAWSIERAGLCGAREPYGDGMFRSLGAITLESLDASPYEAPPSFTI